MFAFALAASLILSDKMIPLDDSVIVMPTRTMAFPIQYDTSRATAIDVTGMYVSTDRGKNWKLHKECKPAETEVRFDAPRDGLYWFALVVVFKDGHTEPLDIHNLNAGQKVYVNTAKRVALKSNPQQEDWKKEIEDLKTEVKRLQKRIQELEAKRNPDTLAPRP